MENVSGINIFRRNVISLFAGSSASWGTSEATTATSKTTASSEHHLHHRCKLCHLGLLTSSASMTHTGLVLSFLDNGDLSTLEQALIVHFRFHD